MSFVNCGRISIVPTRPKMSVVQLLKGYSEAWHRTEFSRKFYSCKICFQVSSLFWCVYVNFWCNLPHYPCHFPCALRFYCAA